MSDWKFGSFEFGDTGVVVHGEPTLDETSDTLSFLVESDGRGPLWIGDIVNYARARWPEEWTQILDPAWGKQKTIEHYAWVAKAVPKEKRKPSLAYSAHDAVAALSVKDRDHILEDAVANDMTQGQVRQAVRSLKRARRAETQADLVGKYRVVYADPPWPYEDQGRMPDGARSTTFDHYDSLPVADIAALPVKAHVQENAALFLWVTSAFLSECWPVIEGWGFTYRTSMVWNKVRHNYGPYLSMRHEFLLIATRGSCTPDRQVPMIESIQTFRQEGEHSSKPVEFRDLIDRLYDGPKVELFARTSTPREGWTFWGDQLGTAAAASG